MQGRFNSDIFIAIMARLGRNRITLQTLRERFRGLVHLDLRDSEAIGISPRGRPRLVSTEDDPNYEAPEIEDVTDAELARTNEELRRRGLTGE